MSTDRKTYGPHSHRYAMQVGQARLREVMVFNIIGFLTHRLLVPFAIDAKHP